MSAKKAYAEKLRDPRWQRKRLKILERDEWRCSHCHDDQSSLQVHHKKYHGDPWEASNDDLETLCEHCHAFVSCKGDMLSASRYLGPEGLCAAILLSHDERVRREASINLNRMSDISATPAFPPMIDDALSWRHNEADLDAGLYDIVGKTHLVKHLRALLDSYDNFYLLYAFQDSLIKLYSGANR